ncbi:orotidine-5'-phosphate decarboxylase [Natranaerobius thermophilus]|nr:orotidine-5'-phosphate decarboxylase [Natranaerobius thermophilus]
MKDKGDNNRNDQPAREKSTDLEDKLIVALDMPDRTQALSLVDELGEQIKWYKIGLELFCSQGPEIISELVDRDKKVFLDLKLHDIPNTVSRTAKELVRRGASMINVHTAGGKDMMARTVEEVHTEASGRGITPPKIVGVTVLTSLGQNEFNNQLGFNGHIEDKVVEWAQMARNSGLDGVVASAKEAAQIKEKLGAEFLIVTPGIRLASDDKSDQKRVLTPDKALNKGATHIVVGRSITGKEGPGQKKTAVQEIYNCMRSEQND